MSIEYEIKPKTFASVELIELWHFRELFYFFTWRDIKVKYKQTVLGFLWAILQPLLMMVIFTMFLGKPFGIPTEGMPYSLFVLSGLVLWSIFAGGINFMGQSMVNNAHIIKKIYFPRLIIPISALLVTLFDFLVSLMIFFCVVVYYAFSKGLHVDFVRLLLVLPVSALLMTMTTLGIGLLLSALNVKYRDIRYIIPFLIQSLMFITPVLYPVKFLKSDFLRNILVLNPLNGALELLRGSFTGQFPSLNLLLLNTGIAFLFLFVGFLYFRRTESYFADIA